MILDWETLIDVIQGQLSRDQALEVVEVHMAAAVVDHTTVVEVVVVLLADLAALQSDAEEVKVDQIILDQ